MTKIFFKITLAVFASFLFIIISGVSGLSFYLWPTTFADRRIEITPAVLNNLKSLRAERKFELDKAHIYFGAPNEAIRSSAQAQVDATIDALLVELPNNPHRSAVLAIFKRNLALCELTDSEERDQLLVYYQKIMDIVGIKSSGELLNVWRYGFPYGWII